MPRRDAPPLPHQRYSKDKDKEKEKEKEKEKGKERPFSHIASSILRDAFILYEAEWHKASACAEVVHDEWPRYSSVSSISLSLLPASSA
jgi:hypothetical protein